MVQSGYSREENIVLRAVEPEDVDFMMECEADSHAAGWSDYRAPLSRAQLLEYALTYDADPFRAGQLRLIAVSSVGERLGIADLYDISEKDSRALVGLTVHPSFRGRGYSVLILDALRRFTVGRLGLQSLAAKISTVNSVALRSFEKAGYRQAALLPRWHRIGLTFHDFHLLLLDLSPSL